MTEQNPDTPTSENASAAQSSGKDQENSKSRGAVGRGSIVRGRGRDCGHNRNLKPNKSSNNILFKGESKEKEFLNVILIANGGTKQAWDIHTACCTYISHKKVPLMHKSIERLTTYGRGEFIKVKIDPKCYTTGTRSNAVVDPLGRLKKTSKSKRKPQYKSRTGMCIT